MPADFPAPIFIGRPAGNLEQFGVSSGQGSGATPAKKLKKLPPGLLKRALAAFNRGILGKKLGHQQNLAAQKIFAVSNNGLGAKAKSALNAVNRGEKPDGDQINALQQYKAWVQQAIELKSTSTAKKQVAAAQAAAVPPPTVQAGAAVASLQQELTAAANGESGGLMSKEVPVPFLGGTVSLPVAVGGGLLGLFLLKKLVF